MDPEMTLFSLIMSEVKFSNIYAFFQVHYIRSGLQ